MKYIQAADGISIACELSGSGPNEIVLLPGLAYPIDLLRDEPGFARFVKRLRGFSRTVWYEGRGIGASGGRLSEIFHDQRSWDSDLNAVLDQCGCQRAALVSSGIIAPYVLSYATKHNDRLTALVIIDGHSHYVREDDYQMGIPAESMNSFLQMIREPWGTGASVALAPSKSGDPAFRERMARCERMGTSPEEATETLRLCFQRDVRNLLPEVRTPTLVLHRRGNPLIRVEAGRYLADHVPGARYVELPDDDHAFFAGDVDALLDEVEEFLTGGHQGGEGDVVTTTILFTDIVSSTEQSARMGHRRWTAWTADHDAMIRATLQRNRGHEIKTIGDGFLVTFDSTTRAVRAAREVVAAARNIGIEVRAGVHTGDVEIRPDDVVGLTVSIAKRICDLAGPGEVFVSEAVKPQLVGSGIAIFDRGTHVLKGVPDEWRLFAVEG